MNTRNEQGIVVDSLGNVDIAYYEAKAQQLRVETIANGLSTATAYLDRQMSRAGRAIKGAFKGYTSRQA